MKSSNDIHQYVTNKIIELLEGHLETWDKPWISLGVDNEPANNPSSSQPHYKGINQFLLSISMMNKGYLKNQWATYAQIAKMEGHVLKGEKSTPVIFYKTAYIDKNKKYYKPDVVKKMDIKTYTAMGIDAVPIIKLYNVFNLKAQTEGLDEQYYDVKPTIGEMTPLEKDETAENIIKETGANIIYRESNRAYYDIGQDQIVSPLREQFKGKAQPFYATILHELTHWTGHKSRLNREFGKEFGDQAYSKEELIAELSSSMLCAQLGFTKTINNSASYISNWLSILKEDNKAILRASGQPLRHQIILWVAQSVQIG